MKLIAVLALLLQSLCAVYAQTEGVLATTGFEEDLAGIVTMDKDAVLTLCKDPDVVFKGNQCLQLRFPQRAISEAGGEMVIPGSLMYPVGQPRPELKTLSFAVAAAHSTPLAVMLSEGENGPRYMALVWCEAGEWHQAKLGLDAFIKGDDSPPDPDGKLTPDKITTIAFLDMGGFTRALGEMATMFYMPPPEDQTLWLDEVQLLSTAPESPKAPADGAIPLNAYDVPLRGVLFIGGKSVTVTRDEAEESAHVKLEYALPPQTILGIVHMVPANALVGAKSLRFRAKSSGAVTLMVQMEEKRAENQKSNYSTAVTLDGLAPWKEVTVLISDLRVDQGRTDPDGKLDLDKVDGVFIADVSAAGAAGDIRNTLWLADLVALK